jgi:hypothetical protein
MSIGKMEDKHCTFIESMHRSLQCPRPRPRPPPRPRTPTATPTSTATPTPTPTVTPNSDSMFSRCHPMQTFVHHLCSIVVRACIFHVFKAVLEHLQITRDAHRSSVLVSSMISSSSLGSYWKRILSPHATLYSSGCVMVVTLSP